MKTKVVTVILLFCLVGLYTPVWSQESEPPIEESGPEGPPAAPINDFIYISFIVAAVVAGKRLFSINKSKN